MFKPEDFELTLESELKLRMMKDEIDRCSDVKQIKEITKSLLSLLMHYQRIIHNVLKYQVQKNLSDYSETLDELFKE
jgi:hypothetical protein